MWEALENNATNQSNEIQNNNQIIKSNLINAIIENNNSEFTTQVNSKSSDISTKDGLGMTALMHACSLGRVSFVRELLQRHADPRVKDEYDRTALIYSCLNGHHECTRLLIDYMLAHPDTTPKRGSGNVMHILSDLSYITNLKRRDWKSIITKENQHDFNTRDCNGSNALMYACNSGHLECVFTLCRNHEACGLDVNMKRASQARRMLSDDMNSLMQACYKGYHRCLAILLSCGADINITNNRGILILHCTYIIYSYFTHAYTLSHIHKYRYDMSDDRLSVRP